ncbi:MAG: ATP-binding protein [Magnetospirillum sp. WYHS-4]
MTDAGASLRRGIGVRLLVRILLVSSLVTLILTATQLFIDYRRDVSDIEDRLAEVEQGHLGSIGRSLWNVDAEQLRLQLEGLLRLPDMQALEVRETPAQAGRPLVVSVGRPLDHRTIRRQYPIVHEDRDGPRTLGILTVDATLHGVYVRLVDRALVILVSQGIKTFVVSMFILFMVHRLVTRHLAAIARHLDRYDLRHGTAPALVLERHRAAVGEDELGQVVDAFNAMQGRLEEAYREQRRREDDLRRAVDELTRSNVELKRFAYVASHDLQEPLRTISIYSQRLQQECLGDKEGEAQGYLDFVVGAAKRMHNLIRDLVSYSSIADNDTPFDAVESMEACHAAAQSLSETILETQAVLDVGSLPRVRADRVQLVQVFHNLIGNALKFHRPGLRPHIAVRAEEANGEWIFSVADNGIGLADSNQDVFAIFRRLHTAHAYPGTGIGLAVCKRIVERHGGRIWAEANPGGGSVFRFTLPAAAC